MRRIATLIAVMVFMSVPSVSFALLDVEVAVGVWQQDPSGYFGYNILGVDDQIDLENDAKYDSESKAMLRAKVDLPLFLPNIYAMYTPMEFEGTGNKTVNFNFNNVPFTAGVDFYSKAKFDHYDVALFWGIPFLQTATLGKLDVEWGINARFIEFEGTITQGATTETVSESLVVPMVYIGVELKPIKSLGVQAEVRGINYDDSSYYDYIARIKYSPLKLPLFIGAGYRMEQIDIDDKNIRADIDVSGPFVEFGLQF